MTEKTNRQLQTRENSLQAIKQRSRESERLREIDFPALPTHTHRKKKKERERERKREEWHHRYDMPYFHSVPVAGVRLSSVSYPALGFTRQVALTDLNVWSRQA